MKKINCLVYLFFFYLNGGYCLANSSNIIIRHNTQEKNISNLGNEVFNYKEIINPYVNEVVINLKSGVKNKQQSNGNPFECIIDIDYTNNLELLNTLPREINFLILHEIGHCVLGKNIMYKPILWVDKNNNYWQKYINQEENLYLKNSTIGIPPALIYHEIFSDIFAIFFLQLTQEEFKSLLIKRKISYYDKQDPHKSYKAILDIYQKKIEISSESIVQETTIMAQQYFIQYLKERKKGFGI